MQEDKYQEFLKTAPSDHFSDGFLEFLRSKYNKVEYENDNWLVIENIKYGSIWLTAFYKRWRSDPNMNNQAATSVHEIKVAGC